MADLAFFLRVRGKISGPFDLQSLQKLVRRGTLSRIHEISSDKVSWNTAGEFEDLFPTSHSAAASQSEISEPESATPESDGTLPPRDAAPEVMASPAAILYYYTQRGSTVGPVPLSVLKTLVENDTLRPDDLVWRENAEMGAAAAQLPALAPLFGSLLHGTSIGGNYRAGRVATNTEKQALYDAVSTADVFARRAGIIVGVTLLLLINLPWFSTGKQLVWWWDLYQVPDGGDWANLITLIMLVAVVLCIVGPLAVGIARGIVYLGLILATAIFLSVAILDSGVVPSALLPLIVFLSLAIHLAASIFRHAAPSSPTGRSILGICSGVVSIVIVVDLIRTIQLNHSYRIIPDGAVVPGGVVFGGVLCFIGLLAGLSAAVMGFVGLKPSFTSGLNQATILSAALALFLPGIGVFLAIVGASGFLVSRLPAGNEISSLSNEEFSYIVEIAARILLIFYACVIVVIAGMRELLINAYVDAPRESRK